ncbi:MAG TPA: hypothetical protein VHR84_14750 [Terriglobales bacterium]|jgi:hypothetical protein|nr:hypothetical protein [Terriglobales bacterium]
MDEGRKRVIGIMAAILGARRLAEFDPAARVPVTIIAVQNAVSWAERILAEIDKRWPTKRETTQ